MFINIIGIYFNLTLNAIQMKLLRTYLNYVFEKINIDALSVTRNKNVDILRKYYE